MDGVILVRRIDCIQQLLFGNAFRQNKLFNRHAERFSALGCAALITQIIRALSAADNRQRRENSPCLERIAIGLDTGVEPRIDLFTQQSLCHSPTPPLS